MANLKTRFAGLDLKNPLIVGSSSLTSKIDNLKKMAAHGAAAIVLKSFFEEEINNEFDQMLAEIPSDKKIDAELDYYDRKIKHDNISSYLKLLKEAKEAVNIPIISSINCVSPHEWIYFLKLIEAAGADAIELNIYYFPADFKRSSSEIEKNYLDIIAKVKAEASIPIIVKMSPYFTNLGQMIKDVSELGVDGITLFNRFYKPDINLDTNELIPASVFSNPNEYLLPLQWIALMSGKVKTPLAASTGIHDGQAFVKLLLAGAHANYIVSALYEKGLEVIEEILGYLESYMHKNHYESVEQMIGKLNESNISNPKYYKRAQFMRYFTDKADVL